MVGKQSGKTAKRVARGGAAAFAVGLFLAGPQAVAAADNQQEAAGSAGAGDAASAATKASLTRGIARPKSGVRGGQASRQARSGRNRSPVATPAAAARATLPIGVKAVLRPASRPAAIESARPVPAVPVEVAAPASLAAAVVSTPGPAAPASPPAVHAQPIRAALFAALDTVEGKLNESSVKRLDLLANLVALLGNQQLSDALGSRLAKFRETKRDQAPSASPVQEDSFPDGQIAGHINAFDSEGDSIEYTLVKPPELGTVEIEEDGRYLYTPGPGYTDSDSFTVEVVDTNGGRNLLDPGAGLSTLVEVQVGAQAPTNPFGPENRQDTALLLEDADARLSVERKLRGLTASVTLDDLPDDTLLSYINGKSFGQVTVGEVAANWEGISNAGKVALGLTYALDDGSMATVFMRSVEITSAGPGQYELSGLVARDGLGTKKLLDLYGTVYEAQFENWLANFESGVSVTGFISNAQLALSTFNVAEAEQLNAGAEFGMPLASSGSLASPTVATTAAAINPSPEVERIVKYGLGYAIGLRDGTVQLWSKKVGFTEVLAASGSAVKTLVADGAGLAVALQDGSIKHWDGTGWTNIASGRGLTLTQMVADGEGFVTGYDNGMVWQWNTSGWKQLTGGVAPETSVQAVTPFKGGIVAGTLDGEYLWDGTTWTRLDVTSSPVTTVVPFGDGAVFGYANGAVYEYDPATYTERLQQIARPTNDDRESTNGINYMVTYRDGFVVTQDHGEAWQYTNDGSGYGWKNIDTPSWAGSATALINNNDQTLVVGTADGAIFESTGYDAPEHQYGAGHWMTLADQGSLDSASGASSDGANITAIAANNGYVFVGLDNGVLANGMLGKQYKDQKWFQLRDLVKDSFNADILKAAVDFANSGQSDKIGTAEDPLFSQFAFQPKCLSTSGGCEGTYVPIDLSSAPETLFGLELKDPNRDYPYVNLGFKMGKSIYGYVYVPPGLWDKLNTDEYSFAMVMALTTGPAVDVGVGDGGTLNVEKELGEKTLIAVNSPPFTFNVAAGAKAGVDLQLGLPEEVVGDGELNAWAYVTGGLVFAYNTRAATWNSSAAYYTDVNWSDFQMPESITLTPYITPYIKPALGIGVVVASYNINAIQASMTYENPFTLEVQKVADSPLSVKLGSSGNLILEANLIPGITDALGLSAEFPLYSVQTDNLLA